MKETCLTSGRLLTPENSGRLVPSMSRMEHLDPTHVYLYIKCWGEIMFCEKKSVLRRGKKAPLVENSDWFALHKGMRIVGPI